MPRERARHGVWACAASRHTPRGLIAAAELTRRRCPPVQASSVATLRQEVTALLGTADSVRGDMVVLRLSSGGGTVTGYGLAAAQLLRVKEAQLNLTVCVEQVAIWYGVLSSCHHIVLSSCHHIIV